MPIEIANRLIELGGVISLGIMALAGMRIWRGGRRRDDQAQRDQKLEQMTDTVRTLQEQVERVQDEMTELNERLDFTERVLTRPKPLSDQVAEATPV